MRALKQIALASLFFIQLSLSGFAQSGIITTYVGPTGLPINGAAAITQVIDKTLSVTPDGAGGVYFVSSQNRVYQVTAAGALILTAGIGTYGFNGDGGPATLAQLGGPQGLAIDSTGNLYIADTGNHRIRKVTTAGVISTVAGGGVAGFSGDGGVATSAQLNTPMSVAVDSQGNLYIADTYNSRVRKVTTMGVISTVAGGAAGFSGDGGPATAAAVSAIEGLAVDSAGNLYIADNGNNRVRKITAATGVISTVAGNGTQGFSGDGDLAIAAELFYPQGVAVDAAGNLYIADSGNNRIRRVTAAGIISTIAGNGTPDFSGDGGLATAAELGYPVGLAVDSAGNLYIADMSNDRIRMVTAAGVISTVAGTGTWGFSGDGGPGTAAQLNSPNGVATDAAGNLYIADSGNNRIRRVTAAGIISTIAGNGTPGFSGDGGAATAAQLNYPWGLGVDSAGNVYIADSGNNRIRRVTAAGIISTIAGNGTLGFSGDGGSATAAQLNFPWGVGVDSAGNVYIADTYNHRVRKITAATGVISTVAGNGTQGFSGDGDLAIAAELFYPQGVAVDAAGNLYVADTDNNRVRKITAATAVISTVAGNGNFPTPFSGDGDGGAATAAELSNPAGVSVDAAGNLYIVDSLNPRIRKVTADGVISTIAGNGTQGFSGDGSPATAAQLYFPYGVAVDTAGNLFIADSDNSRVRMVSGVASVTTFFPQVAVGGGSSTLFTVTNTGSTAAAGNLILTDQQGNPFTVSGVLTDSSGTTQPASVGSSFSINVPAGGTVFLSANALSPNNPLSSGWAELESTGGSLTGVATYEDVSGGILQYMVGVLQSPLLQYATIPVDNDNTQDQQMAYAIANPSSQTISIKLALVGQDGTAIDDTFTVTLGPGQQTARYLLKDLPARANFKGSLVLQGQAGASFIVVALLQKQSLFTVIPLIPADEASASTFFPQVAVGGGSDTLFTVTNTGSTAASGNLILTDQQGNPFAASGVLTDSSGITQPASVESSFRIYVPAGGTVFLSANALSPNNPTSSGWAELESTGGSLTGLATYEDVSGEILQYMVGVLQSPMLQFATTPVDNDNTQDTQMAYAIANPSSQTISIKLALVGQDGTVIDDTVTVTLGPGQQTARYLLKDLPASANFKGSLVLRGQAGAGFIAVALLQKQGLFTVIPLISGKAPGIPD